MGAIAGNRQRASFGVFACDPGVRFGDPPVPAATRRGRQIYTFHRGHESGRRPLLHRSIFRKTASFPSDIRCWTQDGPRFPAGDALRAGVSSLRGGALAYSRRYRARSLIRRRCGRICIGKRKINLSTVFAGHIVGIREIEDQLWLVSFLDYDLGYFDKDEGRVEPGPDPFAPETVLTMSPEQDVNHVTGIHLLVYGAPEGITRRLRGSPLRGQRRVAPLFCVAFGDLSNGGSNQVLANT